MPTVPSPAEALLYHLANRYLRELLPAECQDELKDRFEAAERQVNACPETAAWSQRVLWLSHWQGVLSSNAQLDAITATLSTALLKNKQVAIHYQDKDKPFLFNLFGLIKRDQTLLAVGSFWRYSDPAVLTVRKMQSVELTDRTAIQPAADFDLQSVIYSKLNFPHGEEKLACLQIEFTESVYSYVRDHALEADYTDIIPPTDYHHAGYFLLDAYGVTDGERLRQWIRGFAHKAQVLKPDHLRLAMEKARLDARTNLLTATEFQRCPNREIQRCLRDSELYFVLMILDLDHFKQVNDHNGHDFGDRVLLQVADCIREYDEVARHGGEEFCILLPNTRSTAAAMIGERIRQQIEQQTLKNQHGDTVPITASIGLAVYPDNLPAELKKAILDNPDTADLADTIGQSIFHQADQALYLAKQQGRNRVCLAASLMTQA